MSKKPNILLISIDSLRADHLSCYGYHRTTSPFIDRLASEGALAERLFCPGLPTYPSYTTLYTGQHPLTHGILAHGGDAKLARDAPFLPEIFIEAGYTTCALDNLLRGRPWFGRGYEYYIDPSMRHTVLTVAVTCEDLNSRAIPWIRSHADEPFFMFIHYWDPHWPFKPPAKYRDLFYEGNPTDPNNRSLEKYWEHPLGAMARETWLRTPEGVITDADYVAALYDQEIRHLDDGIAELLGTLDEAGLTEETIVIFTGDHGESLGEHGIYFDHHGLYDCTLQVPFVVRWPGKIPAGRRITPMLQVSDIAPTLLEAVGLPVPSTMEGRSCWKLLTGEEEQGGYARIISAECTWQAAWSLRTDRYKFILPRERASDTHAPCELYDLAQDPREERNLIEEMPDLASAMRQELEDWIAGRLAALERDQDPLIKNGPSMRNTLLANP